MIHTRQKSHWSTFATLYDPQVTEDQPPERRNPKLRRHGTQTAVIPMVLEQPEYTLYRQQRLKTDAHCTYCDRELDLDSASLDHLVPRSRGGKNWPANLVLSCKKCNEEKSDMTPREWHADILAKISEMQQFADRLQTLIDAGNMECYVVDEDAPRAEVVAPTPEAPKSRQAAPALPQAPNLGADRQWSHEEFETGKYKYSIVRKSDNQPVLRNLGINQAAHVLASLEADDLALLQYRLIYHVDLGIRKPHTIVSDAPALEGTQTALPGDHS